MTTIIIITRHYYASFFAEGAFNPYMSQCLGISAFTIIMRKYFLLTIYNKGINKKAFTTKACTTKDGLIFHLALYDNLKMKDLIISMEKRIINQ